MTKKKQIKNKKLSWKFFLLLSAILVLGGTILGTSLYTFASPHLLDSSLTGEEIVEQKQNTIPKDVLASLPQQSNVLGAKSNELLKPTSLHIPILMYHYVEYVVDKGDTKRISLNTTPYTLEQEILALQNAGYTFMTNAEVAQALDGKMMLPAKPVVLTFDDGYRDFYTYAYPILKKYHAKATQYVIAGPAFLNTPNHLTTAQVQEIAQDRLVEIGAHTVDHAWLKGQTFQTAYYQVSESKKILENIIHQPVVSFAYPFGAFDTQAIDAVKKAGFSSATTTVPGIDQLQTDRYFLYRLRPGGRIGKDFIDCLEHATVCYHLPIPTNTK